MHANDFVGLDARVAASAESDAVKAAISELPRLHGGAEALDRVDALLEAAGIAAPLTRELRALVERRCPSRGRSGAVVRLFYHELFRLLYGPCL